MTKYFEPFTEDVYIPSIGEAGEAHYTKIDKELFNQAVMSGWMSGPSDDQTSTN